VGYRPYPNADRAQHQIDRHCDETAPSWHPDYVMDSTTGRIAPWPTPPLGWDTKAAANIRLALAAFRDALTKPVDFATPRSGQR
jgi:hypothetical protein